MSDYSATFPSQRPVFTADFSNGSKIDPRATFSRASTANVFDGAKHLSSENVFLQSSDFDTTWSRSGINGTPTGGQADPAGGTDGFTLVEDTSAGFHRIKQSVSPTGDLSFVVYAKRNSGARYLNLTINSSAGGANGAALATFDLAGGAAHTSNGSSSTLTSLSATQTASGNGYYKCVFKATASAAITTAQISLINTATPTANNYGLVSYTGDASSSIDVAFASLSSVGGTDYNATTTQIHRAYASSLVSKANNIGRFEVGIDGQSEGILIEGQSTNLATYSDDLTVSFWTSNKTNQDNIADVAVGPTGALADMLKPTTATGNHFSQSGNVTTSASSTYTFSAYVKSVNGYRFRLQAVDISPYAQFAGATFTLTGAGSADVGAGSAIITQLSNGWYRVSVTGTAGTTTTGLMLRCADSTGALSFAGDGYSGIICTGVQFELGSHASSMISTSGSGVTRAADSLSVATADIGYTGGDFTVIAEANMPGDNVGNVVEVGDGTASNRATLQARTDGTQGMTVSNAGSVQAYIGNTSARNAKRAMRVATNNFAYCESGGTVATDTTGVVPVTATLYLGKGYSGSELNGTIKRVAIFNEALSDQNLQSLTAS